jgi:hypothetical protein
VIVVTVAAGGQAGYIETPMTATAPPDALGP